MSPTAATPSAAGRYGLLGLLILGMLALGAVGAWVTAPQIPTWYQTLEKPSFNPPAWVFGPVWTALYVMMGVAIWLIAISTADRARRREAVLAFVMQLALNVAWSPVFFGLHAPHVALVIVVALLVAIVVAMRTAWHVSHAAALLLAPYLAWVAFATVLNASIAILN